MSITVANSAANAVMVTAVVGIAQRLVQGEWSCTWMAWFWGGILALCLLASCLAGIYALIEYFRRRKR